MISISLLDWMKAKVGFREAKQKVKHIEKESVEISRRLDVSNIVTNQIGVENIKERIDQAGLEDLRERLQEIEKVLILNPRNDKYEYKVKMNLQASPDQSSTLHDLTCSNLEKFRIYIFKKYET